MDCQWAIIHLSIFTISTSSLHRLLRLGLSQDAKHDALRYAIDNNSVEHVKLLLDYGTPMDVEGVGGTALQRAFQRGSLEVASLLVRRGADVNKRFRSSTLMHQVAAFLPSEDLRLAIEKGGSPIDPLDYYGRTPLICAAMRGHVSIVRGLASRNADVNVKDKDGNTALHHLVPYDRDAMVPVLIKLGLSINARNNKGQTALHLAAEIKCSGVVRELILLDADSEVRDNHGLTALQLATLSNEDNVVSFLKRLAERKNGASLDAGSKHGHIEATYSGGEDPARRITQRPETSSLETATEDSQRRESEAWLNRIKLSSITSELISEFSKLDRIKIAVLDTGYDPETDFFRDKQRKRRIKAFQDWVVKDSTTAEDEDGHGTHVLSLVMKIAPAADIFVCRIARGRGTQDLRDASGNVAEAITRAAIDWKVDIISMSFGYPEEVLINGVGLISNAISRALSERNQRLLFFAAASNGGPAEQEMFPASSPSVMSIRGSDAKGWLQLFNALPDPHNTKCFMTLGQCVPGASLSRDNGIAALILGYARVHEEELKGRLGEDKHKLSKLWQISGMRAMFAAISTPTYVLSPNFSYHPNTSICMGDIILDPTDPTKPLSSPSSLAATESHIDYDVHLSKHKSRSLHGSIWAKFLEVADAKLGGGASSNVLTKYTMDRLETVYFRKQPTDDEAAERAKDKRVQAAINSGLLGKRPVYMITGLKIARGFRLRSQDASSMEGEIGGGGQVVPEASIGGGVDFSDANDTKQSYRAGSDIVFAYQLHIIAHKGWRQKRVDISVYKAKAAFLNEEEITLEEEEVETSAADLEGLCAFDEEAPVQVLTAMEGDETYTCIVFEDE
ncbi:hypothetical protein CNMCM5623_007223 [Aspergillus felis]|uniref:Peptidase S8/S53 domain-containing protein n=1 Tax=Aspergillus felis TaxID=1287682 RepID=A0A8H6PXB0_9EURO|nr:hypothetical protein CNMCM5623_007223 [Aspergillus felis]